MKSPEKTVGVAYLGEKGRQNMATGEEEQL